MKIINLESKASRDELIGMIRNFELVNDRVKFDENKGKPRIYVKEKGTKIKIKCEMIGGKTKDNAFLEGTYFVGSLKESNGLTRLKGVILTAPIYHSFIAVLTGLYVWRCISLGGFHPLPLIALIFSFMMFKSEFEKQGTIERYLVRAFKKVNN